MCDMMNEQEVNAQLDKMTQELRRGALVLATLSQLKEAKYGYSLMSSMAEKGLEIEQGTLYPLLRRLETQGLLQSEWNVEGSRPRRYYALSPAGTQILETLVEEWHILSEVIEKLIDENRQEGE